MHRRFVALLLITACRAAPEAVGVPGEAVPDLSAGEHARFEQGDALFDRDFSEAEGLGPLFNQRRCSSCHDIPTPGGNGSELVTKVTRWESGRCDLLTDHGGDLLQSQVIDTLRALGYRSEPPPANATAVSSIHAPPLYGLGLLEAIPESQILAHADPEDADGDGIRGRAVRLADGRLARFGRKLRFATVRDFTEDAARDELGLTSRNRPDENTYGGTPLPEGIDRVPDPEVDDAVIDRLADYVRLLAAPVRDTAAAAADSIAAGASVFADIGCARCHVPTMTTVSADVPALNGRTVYLYSDLLLHDMGDELASICGPAAGPSEWRTSPLLGLRYRVAYLHDGRTQSFRGAIEAHGGEAAAARAAYRALPPDRQAMLLRFLASI